MSPHPAFQDETERLESLRTFFLLLRRGITESRVIVNVHSLDEVKAVLDGFGGWDNYVPDKILESMTTIWPEVNRVQMGVEGSPVIYIQIPLWLGQVRKNYAKHQLTQDQVRELYFTAPEEESLEEMGKRSAALTGDRRLTEDERKEILSMVYKTFNCYDPKNPDDYDYKGPTEADYEEGAQRFPAISFSVRLWWD